MPLKSTRMSSMERLRGGVNIPALWVWFLSDSIKLIDLIVWWLVIKPVSEHAYSIQRVTDPCYLYQSDVVSGWFKGDEVTLEPYGLTLFVWQFEGVIARSYSPPCSTCIGWVTPMYAPSFVYMLVSELWASVPHASITNDVSAVSAVSMMRCWPILKNIYNQWCHVVVRVIVMISHFLNISQTLTEATP